MSFHIACLEGPGLTRHRKVYFGTLPNLKDDPNKVVNDFVFEQYFRPCEHIKVPGNCQSAKTTANFPKEASKSLRISETNMIWFPSQKIYNIFSWYLTQNLSPSNYMQWNWNMNHGSMELHWCMCVVPLLVFLYCMLEWTYVYQRLRKYILRLHVNARCLLKVKSVLPINMNMQSKPKNV